MHLHWHLYHLSRNRKDTAYRSKTGAAGPLRKQVYEKFVVKWLQVCCAQIRSFRGALSPPVSMQRNTAAQAKRI